MQKQRTLLITGAARRLGRALAVRAANAGWNVALHCHRSVSDAEAVRQEMLKHGTRAEIFPCDLADAAAVQNLIPAILEKMGPLSALVNNASLFLKDTYESATHHDAHFQVNHNAPLHLIHALAAQLPQGETGSVLNILDGCFGWSMGPNFYSYTESRLALWRETEPLARAHAPRLRINALAPGHTFAGDMDKAKTAEKLRAETPLGRLSSLEEFCDAAMFLLHAPSITGQVLQLNGGLGLGNISMEMTGKKNRG